MMSARRWPWRRMSWTSPPWPGEPPLPTLPSQPPQWPQPGTEGQLCSFTSQIPCQSVPLCANKALCYSQLGRDIATGRERLKSGHRYVNALSAFRLSLPVACRLISIPEWLAAPSKYQRYWVRYTLAGMAGLWTLRFLYM